MDKRVKEVEEIEAAQRALRDSIEVTKDLAEKTEDLLQKHKRSLEDDNSDH